jgi:hypothetical protein
MSVCLCTPNSATSPGCRSRLYRPLQLGLRRRRSCGEGNGLLSPALPVKGPFGAGQPRTAAAAPQLGRAAAAPQSGLAAAHGATLIERMRNLSAPCAVQQPGSQVANDAGSCERKKTSHSNFIRNQVVSIALQSASSPTTQTWLARRRRLQCRCRLRRRLVGLLHAWSVCWFASVSRHWCCSCTGGRQPSRRPRTSSSSLNC